MLDLLTSPAVAASIIVGIVTLFFLWPRVSSKSDAPPMVFNSPIVKIPLFGIAIEFGMSPVKMVRRCYDKYGPVFTVPVSLVLF